MKLRMWNDKHTHTCQSIIINNISMMMTLEFLFFFLFLFISVLSLCQSTWWKYLKNFFFRLFIQLLMQMTNNITCVDCCQETFEKNSMMQIISSTAKSNNIEFWRTQDVVVLSYHFIIFHFSNIYFHPSLPSYTHTHIGW